jgi:uncharacterized membrane protein YebE (DUF533 family)
MARTVGQSLRRHPLPTLALLAVLGVLLATAVAVLLALVLVAAVLAAVGALGYLAVRELVQAHARSITSQRPSRRIDVRVGAERYLAYVDQFARLLQAALAAGIEARPRRGQLRRTLEESERLRALLRELARNWRGPAAIGTGIYELEDATIALVVYLQQLSRDKRHRPPAAILRDQAEALSRRLDVITLRLRRTDFRTARESVRV